MIRSAHSAPATRSPSIPESRRLASSSEVRPISERTSSLCSPRVGDGECNQLDTRLYRKGSVGSSCSPVILWFSTSKRPLARSWGFATISREEMTTSAGTPCPLSSRAISLASVSDVHLANSSSIRSWARRRPFAVARSGSVSYTHLDVYKRQLQELPHVGHFGDTFSGP